MTAAWPVAHHQGSAVDFHELAMPEEVHAELWWFEVEQPALVLGSTQPWAVADAERVAAAGVELARRRSGGGAVLLVPGQVTWVDVLLPASSPLWEHDVGRSFAWLGEAWVRALGSLGIDGGVAHIGPLAVTPWSRLVCFGGLGPGEVTVGGRKVVGIAQRRTRHGARFQCACLHEWDAAAVVELLHLSAGDRSDAIADLEPVAGGVGDVTSAAVVDALVDALPT